MAEKTVSIWEARQIRDRLWTKRDTLLSIMGLITRDTERGLGLPTYSDSPTVEVEGGENVTVNVGDGSRVLSDEALQTYRTRLKEVQQEIEKLDAIMAGIDMVVRKAELDTQVTIVV